MFVVYPSVMVWFLKLYSTNLPWIAGQTFNFQGLRHKKILYFIYICSLIGNFQQFISHKKEKWKDIFLPSNQTFVAKKRREIVIALQFELVSGFCSRMKA